MELVHAGTGVGCLLAGAGGGALSWFVFSEVEDMDSTGNVMIMCPMMWTTNSDEHRLVDNNNKVYGTNY